MCCWVILCETKHSEDLVFCQNDVYSVLYVICVVYYDNKFRLAGLFRIGEREEKKGASRK